MNTLLDLMHQVWRRRTPVRPSSSAAVLTPHAAESPSDLWAWYQSRCTEEPSAER